MKKIILLLALAFSINVSAQKESVSDKTSKSIETVYADSKQGISTVYNDLKSTAPQIKNALESLSKELKTTSESLWSILVKQQLVWSWGYLVLMLASICNWFLFYRRNLSKNLKYDKVKITVQKLMYKEGTSEEDAIKYPNSYGASYKTVDEEDFRLVPNSTIPQIKYLHLVICLILSFFSFIHFSDMLTGFINPEYGALKTIVETVGKLK